MPLSKYFHGHGEEVAADMQRRYGSRWKQVFYATVNARKKRERRQRLFNRRRTKHGTHKDKS